MALSTMWGSVRQRNKVHYRKKTPCFLLLHGVFFLVNDSISILIQNRGHKPDTESQSNPAILPQRGP